MKWKEAESRCSTPECGEERRPGGRYCRKCHAEHQAAYRERHKEKIAALLQAAKRAGVIVTEWESA